MNQPGDVLAGRYTLSRLGWKTQRGPVWQARDNTLDRRVHILLLDDRFLEDRSARRAFVDEAAQAAAKTDPYLASVFDIGTDPPFVVFEDSGGGRLIDRLRSGPLPANVAAQVAANVARGLQGLEVRGEPLPRIDADAVLLSSDGRGKLATFATATAAQDARRELAALTYLMFTGDEPADDKVSKKEVPAPLAEMCSRMLAGSPTSLESFVDACATLTRPEPVKGKRRRRGSGDFGWLVAVVSIVALAVVAVVVGPSLIDNFSRKDATATPTSTATSKPSGTALTIDSVTDFDPAGNGEEHPEQAGRAIDGDPVTEWTTVNYTQAAMDKEGVGLLVDLGSEQTFSAIQVQSSLPGWEAEIRVASQEPTDQDDLETITSFTAGSDSLVKVKEGTKAQWILVWLTKLAEDAPESDLPYRGRINELTVLG